MATIKTFNDRSDLEKALQEVEAVLQKHDLRIEQGYGGLNVYFRGETFETIDTESPNEKIHAFPRSFDSEKVLFSRE
jgi:hypothetical protein